MLVAVEVNEKPHCHYLSKSTAGFCCYHNALSMSATALRRVNKTGQEN